MIEKGRRAPLLVIFCRRPERGVGKRRIAHALGNQVALELAEHLLSTTLEDANDWPGPVVLSPAKSDDLNWARALRSPGYEVIAQPSGNLGNRINAVDQLARSKGHEQLIYIGSDAPVLTKKYFSRARVALANHDTVLGPAEDGGVTLMASRKSWPDLTALPWSSPDLGSELELICMEAGHTVYLLEPRYDIDRSTDLPKLREDLRGDSRPARMKLCRWLEETGLVPLRQPNKNSE